MFIYSNIDKIREEYVYILKYNKIRKEYVYKLKY